MLALTKKTDYALIAVAYLARRFGEVSSAREISQATRVALPILTNILKTLAGARIVASERGATGGYALARRPESISLHDLIGAIEGPFQFVQCVTPVGEEHRSTCELESWCPIRVPAMRIHDRLREFLRGVTLAELVEDTDRLVQVRSMELESASAAAGPVKECAT